MWGLNADIPWKYSSHLHHMLYSAIWPLPSIVHLLFINIDSVVFVRYPAEPSNLFNLLLKTQIDGRLKWLLNNGEWETVTSSIYHPGTKDQFLPRTSKTMTINLKSQVQHFLLGGPAALHHVPKGINISIWNRNIYWTTRGSKTRDLGTLFQSALRVLSLPMV